MNADQYLKRQVEDLRREANERRDRVASLPADAKVQEEHATDLENLADELEVLNG